VGSFKTTAKELRKKIIAREGPIHCRTQGSKVLVCTLYFYYALHVVLQMTKFVATCIYLIRSYCSKAFQPLILLTAVRYSSLLLTTPINFYVKLYILVLHSESTFVGRVA